MTPETIDGKAKNKWRFKRKRRSQLAPAVRKSIPGSYAIVGCSEKVAANYGISRADVLDEVILHLMRKGPMSDVVLDRRQANVIEMPKRKVA